MTRAALAWPLASMCAWTTTTPSMPLRRASSEYSGGVVYSATDGSDVACACAEDANVAHRLAAIAGELTHGRVVDGREIRRADFDRRAAAGAQCGKRTGNDEGPGQNGDGPAARQAGTIDEPVQQCGDAPLEPRAAGHGDGWCQAGVRARRADDRDQM